MIKDLKDRATKMYDIQNDWIGQRFQKEMDRYWNVKITEVVITDNVVFQTHTGLTEKPTNNKKGKSI